MRSSNINAMTVERRKFSVLRMLSSALGCIAPLGEALAGTGEAAREPVNAGTVLNVVVGLVIVLLLIALVAWIVRHSGRLQPGVSGEMRILAGLSMGSRERVVLLQVGTTQLLVGVAPGRIVTLHVLDDPLPVPARPTGPGGFAEQLGALLSRTARARAGGGDAS